MVQRNSQAVNFGSGGNTTIQQSSAGFVRPDSDAFRGNTVIQQVSGDSSSTERVLNTLLGVTGKLAAQKFEQSQQEAMLAGAAAANAGKSEAELQTNPLTKDWQVAGYRDTAGRLKAADQQAQIAVDMKRMAEKSPEEYGQYLAQKRAELEDAYAGMTLESRKAMLVQQAANDRSNIAKHQAAHAQFIVDTETKSLAASAQTMFSALDSAKVDAKVYGETTDAAMVNIIGNVVMNPKLPPDVQSKLVTEFAERALAGDHQALFTRMQQQVTTLPDGRSGTVMSLVDIPTQTKLAGQYRESLARTEAARNTGYMEEQATMRAAWADPNAPLQSPAEVLGFLRRGVSTGVIKSDEKYEALYQEYLTGASKKANQGALGAAWAAGDSGKMISLDKTQSEGLDAYMATMGRNMSTQQLVNSLLDIGLNTGQELAFKKAGEIMAPAFVQLGLRDTVDPQQAAALSSVLGRIESAGENGASGAMSQFLSAFSPEAQAKVAYLRDNLKNRMDPVSAIVSAGAKVKEESDMTPAVRAALSASKAKDITAALDDMAPRDVLGTVSLYAKRLLVGTKISERAGTELRLRPFEGWWDSSDQTEKVLASTKLRLANEMTEIQRNNPSMSAQSVRDRAMANVNAATVDTRWGPLTVPAGMSPQRYFGVDTQVPNDRIGSALQEYIKPQEGNRLAFSLGLQGQLVVEELNQKGDRMGSQTVDPKQVGEIVRAQQGSINKRTDEVWGRGVTSHGVQFNGQNTGNADPAWTMPWRKSLLDNGVVRITSEDKKLASVAFNSDSDKAAGYGQRMMIASGKNNQAAFNLYATMAMADDKFNTQQEYRSMLRSIKANDAQGALAALRSTTMYKGQPQEKQAYYERLLDAALKGQ